MMPMYLTEDEVRELLPMQQCIELMRGTFADLATGKALNQPRRRLYLPTRAGLHYMAGGCGRYYGIKVYSTHPKHAPDFRFLLYAAEDAELLAILEANYLGQIRTGAASGLATDLLALKDAKSLAIIGSGFQARSQLEAIGCVRGLEQVRVWSRSEEKRSAFADEAAKVTGAVVRSVATAEEAVRGAEILVTATNSAEPVVEAEWVAAGTHINAMGSNQAKRRELPTGLVQSAGLVAVDSAEVSRMESGDLLLAWNEEDWKRAVELQEVVAGRTGRQRPDEITLYKSNGLAVEDVAAAGYVYEQAKDRGLGRGRNYS